MPCTWCPSSFPTVLDSWASCAAALVQRYIDFLVVRMRLSVSA